MAVDDDGDGDGIEEGAVPAVPPSDLHGDIVGAEVEVIEGLLGDRRPLLHHELHPAEEHAVRVDDEDYILRGLRVLKPAVDGPGLVVGRVVVIGVVALVGGRRVRWDLSSKEVWLVGREQAGDLAGHVGLLEPEVHVPDLPLEVLGRLHVVDRVEGAGGGGPSLTEAASAQPLCLLVLAPAGARVRSRLLVHEDGQVLGPVGRQVPPVEVCAADLVGGEGDGQGFTVVEHVEPDSLARQVLLLAGGEAANALVRFQERRPLLLDVLDQRLRRPLCPPLVRLPRSLLASR
mmetsp:Transcript_36070/g.112742  ORF Transcript_36070/g.112742 Transcript_36070/m.112742 type:complete len:289 (-) Transcript_36070:1139-2005(-)